MDCQEFKSSTGCTEILFRIEVYVSLRGSRFFFGEFAQTQLRVQHGHASGEQLALSQVCMSGANRALMDTSHCVKKSTFPLAPGQ